MSKVRQQIFALRIALYLLSKNDFPAPTKRHVLSFIRLKNLLSFPDEELQTRQSSDRDLIWENDIAWKRKDLFECGEIASPERGRWQLTTHGIAKIDQSKAKWLVLESNQKRTEVLSCCEYWTDELICWMLKIAKDQPLTLGRSQHVHDRRQCTR